MGKRPIYSQKCIYQNIEKEEEEEEEEETQVN